MKIVFESPSEKKRIEAIVRDASSVSNSQSLMALVADGMIEGEDPIIVEKVSSVELDPKQEPMQDLIARADEMGIRGASEMSRAGIIQAMDAMKEPELKDEVSDSAPEAPVAPPEFTDDEKETEAIYEKAHSLGIDTEGMTQNQVLDAIKELE